MSHKIVRSLLEARLAAWAKLQKPVLRIAYQNVVFKPADGETYLRAFLIPAHTGSDDLAGEHRGLYRSVSNHHRHTCRNGFRCGRRVGR